MIKMCNNWNNWGKFWNINLKFQEEFIRFYWCYLYFTQGIQTNNYLSLNTLKEIVLNSKWSSSKNWWCWKRGAVYKFILYVYTRIFAQTESSGAEFKVHFEQWTPKISALGMALLLGSSVKNRVRQHTMYYSRRSLCSMRLLCLILANSRQWFICSRVQVSVQYWHKVKY